MGISDRYYMNGTEESVNFTGRRFSAVNLMIIINVLVWIAWQIARSNDGLLSFMLDNFLVSPAGVLKEYRIHTLLTAAVSHRDIAHIFWNLLFFWGLGTDVERIYGYRNFLWLYVFCGVIASASQLGVEVMHHSGVSSLGASGAVMGIALVAAFFDPNRPIVLYLVTLPLKWVVGIYIMMDISGALDGGGPVANAAHLGGALAGVLYYKLDLRLFSSPGRSDVGLWNSFKKIFRRKPSLRVREHEIPEELPREPVAKAERVGRAAAGSSRPPPRNVDVATSRRVDELLGKISREGIGALTDEERTFLKESSQKYKK